MRSQNSMGKSMERLHSITPLYKVISDYSNGRILATVAASWASTARCWALWSVIDLTTNNVTTPAASQNRGLLTTFDIVISSSPPRLVLRCLFYSLNTKFSITRFRSKRLSAEIVNVSSVKRRVNGLNNRNAPPVAE